MQLIVQGIKKKFGAKEVLKGINFSFEKGKIYGLLGRNGAGKTTFFNCLNEDIKVDEGKFIIKDNQEQRKVDISDIGYVVSTPNVPEFLTGREFLKFFLEINENNIQNPRSIDEYFDFMKIDEADRDKLLKDYSHGMKNKTYIFCYGMLQTKFPTTYFGIATIIFAAVYSIISLFIAYKFAPKTFRIRV